MEKYNPNEYLQTLHEIEDLDDFEKRVRRVYHELLDFMQLVWRAKVEEHLVQDLIKSTIKNKTKLSFVETTTSDPTSTECNLQLNQSCMRFRGWNALEENEQGLSIVLSAFQAMVDSQIVWPTIRFSPFAGAVIDNGDLGSLATFTHPEMIPEYFQKMIIESLVDNGFVYVPYQQLQCVCDTLRGGDKSIDNWWQRYFHK